MEAIRNVRVRELLLILAKLNVAFELVDILYDPRSGVIIVPVKESERPVPLTEEEKKQLNDKLNKLDPDMGLEDLIG